MSFKGLNAFQYFDLEDFLAAKRLVFVKAAQWSEGEGKDAKLEGSKVVVQIAEDKTKYGKEGIDNFGEQFAVKVRGVAPSAYHNLKPLNTEVAITDVERASIYGDWKNQLSIIAVISVVEAHNEKKQ